jgi:drug/metabolite transporter (DMT)-like permease
LWGLRVTLASTASLLLNLEGVFTALLAWHAFREHADRRLKLGFALIVAAGVLLSWQGSARVGSVWGPLAIAGACLCWAVDNNLTQKVAATDAVQLVTIKGLIAGGVNLAIAVALGSARPSWPLVLGTLLLGFLSYGASLVLFVVALRHLGTARTSAYFALAPFVGAVTALLLLREPVVPAFLPAAVLMGLGLWLHLAERHAHEHTHAPLRHAHPHRHDAHHQHAHPAGVAVEEGHTHEHEHAPLTHAHRHYPDVHHRHGHAPHSG